MQRLIILLATLAADPPRFEVVNRCPPKFEVVNRCPAPAVVGKATFRDGSFNASHQCPNCGKSQYRIAGYVGNGQHRHVCAACSTSWVH